MILTDSSVTPYSTKTESCLTSQFLGELRLVDEEVISGYVSTLCTKFCALDAIPSSGFQRGQDRLVPIITRIVNLSLQGGQVPDRFKVGVIKPLLKKIGADHDNFSNFRPVSNLHFLSKVTREVVTSRCHGSKISGRQQTKNVTQKVNPHCHKLHRSYSISFNLPNVGEIFWG